MESTPRAVFVEVCFKFSFLYLHHHLCFPPPIVLTSLYLHHLTDHWADLVSPSNGELWSSSYRLLTLVSVASFLDSVTVFARTVTLELGLRTIPSVVSSFRYLSSNPIVSLDPLSYCNRLIGGFFFFVSYYILSLNPRPHSPHFG